MAASLELSTLKSIISEVVGEVLPFIFILIGLLWNGMPQIFNTDNFCSDHNGKK